MWISRKGYYDLMDLALKNNFDYKNQLRENDIQIHFLNENIRRIGEMLYNKNVILRRKEEENKELQSEIERLKKELEGVI